MEAKSEMHVKRESHWRGVVMTLLCVGVAGAGADLESAKRTYEEKNYTLRRLRNSPSWQIMETQKLNS